jgi:hypothetical protein
LTDKSSIATTRPSRSPILFGQGLLGERRQQQADDEP